MEQRRLGRDTWAQFEDPIADLSTGKLGRVDEDSLKDSNIPHVTRAGQLGSSDDHDSSFFPAGPPVDSYGSLSTRKVCVFVMSLNRIVSILVKRRERGISLVSII
ncbi:hypothetical protein FGIG_01433 [Fasciola gigantica]|uniref:Uncharacterized protein n=1 Tax=Fasciola gigantica TaxID=46835 RepID=A0A504YIF7_FASGI|nr:hypothetical protein FGIG_01433 [Fasciola gigantica]